MRKSRIAKTIARTLMPLAAIMLNTTASEAQKYTLEFKTGAMATSTISDASPYKSITDYKAGATMGGAFGTIFANEMLRGMLECYYTAKGEKYTIDHSYGSLEPDQMQFCSDLNYFQTCPNIRFYTPYFPLYAGAGIYYAISTTRNVKSGYSPSQSHSRTDTDYYSRTDFGARAAAGTEIGVGSVRLLLEASYEYGLSNICKIMGRNIRNQSVLLQIGVSFQIEGRHFRHY